MQICFNGYKRRDGILMIYVNRSNKMSVGLSPDRGWTPYGKGVTEGMRNTMNAANAVFFAHSEPFTGDLSKHDETGFCAPVNCGPYILVGTDIATIGGQKVGSDGAYIIRDRRILKAGVWFDEPETD